MSNDLISRSVLMDRLRENVLIDVTSELEKEIQGQPAAYDAEKVVKQICGCDGCSGCCNCHEEEKMLECEEYARVYGIVKAGGVNE